MPVTLSARRVSRLLLAPLASGALVALAVTAAVAVTVPATDRQAPSTSTAVPGVRVTWAVRASGLVEPTQVTSANDGVGRLFIVEKRGTIRVFRNGSLRQAPYLNISGIVLDQGERGLLSVAFSPSFRTNPYLFVAWNRSDGDVVLSRFKASTPTTGWVSPSTRRDLLVVEHSAYSNHNGGQLMFGPGGYLYFGVGDGGGQGDPLGSGQSLTTYRGKILRLKVLGCPAGRLVCIPPGNPYVGPSPALDGIWLSGLRNPWRFSFDPANGNLWIGDVGQDRYEEVDRVGPTNGGANLGWSCWEAWVHYNTSRCRSGVTYRFPVFAYPHSVGESVTGGFVYRGKAYASLMAGRYVFGDYITGKVWAWAVGTGQRPVLQAQRLGGAYGGPTSFGVGDTRELWAVTFDGRLWQMAAHPA